MMTIAFLGLLADSWDMHDGGGGAWMGVGMIGMTIFWGAIVLGFVWLVRNGTDRRERPPEETPLSLLDRRFAEGGLSPEEYQQRRAILTETFVSS